VRSQVEEIIGTGRNPVTGPIPFTPQTKKVLELSLREALALGHHYIGTEHLLLAMLREGQGVAAQVLTRLGTDHAQVQETVVGLLTGECEQRDIQAQLAADLVDAAEELTQVRQDKEAAFDAGDLAAAAALRDREKQLLAHKLRLEQQLTAGAGAQAVIAENQRRELQRLRDLLRQHGIEPDNGSARTA
jgi:ATP-dependent Clp protease ATP-binding subunit ClpA